MTAEHLDVVIIGAGLSGIGAAYRLQTQCPDRSYTILESRAAMGGTWDLFRYPGVRSDSDMYTLGYAFRPWHGTDALADGASILRYIRDTAREHGIDRHIRYRTRVVAADWSSADARWTLTLRDGQTLTCSFLYSCAGYYDYDRAHEAALPGLADFAGTVVHPQFWPAGLDITGKRVVVVGSGATAVTLVPAMTGTAAHVTMLQRTPTWISPVPGRDALADRLRRLLPDRAAHRLIRGWKIAFGVAFYQFCRRRPAQARRLLTGLATRALGDRRLVEEHFTPPYDPWDQRLCAIPDADLFREVRRGRAEVVTGHIDTFTASGVRLRSGRQLPADVVVTATGLQLLAVGGVALHVDGEPVHLPDRFVWRGAMLTGVPNFAICMGYTNASWTLRADLTHRLVCRVLRHMRRHGLAAVVPEADGPLTERPLLDLMSGYVLRSVAAFPRQADRSPWRVRQNYLLDVLTTVHGRLGRTLRGIPAAPLRRPAAATVADPHA